MDIPRIINRNISSLFSMLIILFIGTFSLGILLYGETFSFWNSAFSDLGSTVTPGGVSNSLSSIIFIIGMLISSFVFFKISQQFKTDPDILHYRQKQQLSLTGGIGCFIFICPYNINDDIHMIGAALMVASIWAIGTLLLIEARKFVQKEKVLLLQTILQGTVLTYAFTYFADMAVRDIAQKFAVLGLIIVLKITTAPIQAFEFSSIFAFNLRQK